MTKEITKAYIIQQIQDKFGLREHDTEKFVFSEAVVPTYDVGQHVQKWVLNSARVSITSAAAFAFFTVPQNEKWHLRGYNIIFLGAGAIQVTGVYIYRQLTPLWFVYLDMTLNQTISYAINLPQPVVLNPGDKIYVLCDDYISTQSLDLNIDIMVEEIR